MPFCLCLQGCLFRGTGCSMEEGTQLWTPRMSWMVPTAAKKQAEHPRTGNIYSVAYGDIILCGTKQGWAPTLNWSWVHLLAPSTRESTTPLSPLHCIAQGPFWAYQRPISTKFNLAKLKFLWFCILQAWFEVSTPFSRYAPSPALRALLLQGENFRNASLRVFPLVVNANALYNPTACWGNLCII